MLAKISAVVAMFVAVIVLVYLNGCSLIGFGIGSTIEHPKPGEFTAIPGWKVGIVEPGEWIEAILDDGERVGGKYTGLDEVSQEEYARRYAIFRKWKEEELILPALHDTIGIVMQSGAHGQRELLGFDCQYLPGGSKEETGALAPPSYVILVKRLADTTSQTVLLRFVETIVDGDGNAVQGEALRRLASEGEIPFLSAIAIQDSTGKRLIGMDKVYQIEVPKKADAKWTGFAIGALIDVIVIGYFISPFDPLEGVWESPE